MNSLVQFLVLTFALTWTCFLALIGLAQHGTSGAITWPILYLGVFAPSLVALALTAHAEGRAGVRAFVSGLFRRQAGAGWYVFAAGYFSALKLMVALLHRLAYGVWPRFGDEAWYIMLVAIVFSTPVQAGEEIGWRGFALPRLASLCGLRWASVLLGAIWACWHLPLFFLPGADTYGQSFPVYLLQVIAISVAMAWLYARTQGNLLLVMLMHAAINNPLAVIPSTIEGATNVFSLSHSRVAWLTLALLWVAAGYFLVRMPRLEETAHLDSARSTMA